MNFKPLNDYLLIQEIEEEYKTKSWIFLAESKEVSSSRKGKIIWIWPKVEWIEVWQIVWYPLAYAEKMTILGVEYNLLQSKNLYWIYSE